MSEKAQTAKLEFNGNFLELRFYDLNAEEFNPGGCRFDIRVVSGDFSGAVHELDGYHDQIVSLIAQLKDITEFKSKEAHFADIDGIVEVDFVGDGIGHIKVSGVLEGNGQSLKFEFETDQTVYTKFISELHSVAEHT